ncbi:MAG: type II secretion system F family protein, partial [Halomonas sp.]|nr:type II secretion system F family protein [Halomonas sp.]
MATARKLRPQQKTKLYRWNWSGKGPGGRKVGGEIIAAQKGEVERILSGQNIIIKNVRRKGGFGGGMGKIKPRDIMLFARQMATM